MLQSNSPEQSGSNNKKINNQKINKEYICTSKTTKILLLIIFLAVAAPVLFSQNASASKEIIFNDYVDLDSNLRIGAADYSFYSSTNDSIDVKSFKTIRVKILGCSDINNLEFCYLLKSQNRVKVQIAYLLPTITIDRALNDDLLYFGRETTGSINIVNEGDYIAKNFTYTDNFPQNAKITLTEGPCKKTNTQITYSAPELDINKAVSCSFKIEPLDVFDLATTAAYSYYDGTKQTTQYTGKILLKSKSGVTTTDTLVSEANVGDEFEYRIAYVNDNNIDFNAKIDMDLPQGVNVVANSGDIFYNATNTDIQDPEILQKNGVTSITKNITILRGTTKTISVILKSVKPGNMNILRKTTFNAKDKDNNPITLFESNQKIITIDRNDLEILTNFASDDETVESGQKILLEYDLKNSNSDLYFQNININFTSSLFFIESNRIDSIDPLTTKKIFSRAFIIPDVTEQKRFPMVLQITYETKYGEKLKTTVTKYITVKPKGDIAVTHTINSNDKEIAQGQDSTIITTVKNNRNEDYDRICIKEDFENLILTKGITNICFSINKNEQKNILKYYIRPADFKNGTINTFLDVEESQNNFSKTNYVTTENIRSNETIPTQQISEDNNIEGTFSVDKTSIYSGDIISVILSLTNDNSFQIQNVTLENVMVPELDYIQPDDQAQNFRVDSINPGETVKKEIYKVRTKKSGSTYIPETKIFFRKSQQDPKQYYSEINRFPISVISTGINTPAIIMNKIFSEPQVDLTKNYSAMTSLEIENIGDNTAKIYVTDSFFNSDRYFEIPPHSKKIIQGNITISDQDKKISKYNSTYAVAKYTVNGFNMTTVSNTLTLQRYRSAEKKKIENASVINASTELKHNVSEKITGQNGIENKSISERTNGTSSKNTTGDGNIAIQNKVIKKKNVFADILEKIKIFLGIK